MLVVFIIAFSLGTAFGVLIIALVQVGKSKDSVHRPDD
jgi:hypothetical protein